MSESRTVTVEVGGTHLSININATAKPEPATLPADVNPAELPDRLTALKMRGMRACDLVVGQTYTRVSDHYDAEWHTVGFAQEGPMGTYLECSAHPNNCWDGLKPKERVLAIVEY